MYKNQYLKKYSESDNYYFEILYQMSNGLWITAFSDIDNPNKRQYFKICKMLEQHNSSDVVSQCAIYYDSPNYVYNDGLVLNELDKNELVKSLNEKIITGISVWELIIEQTNKEQYLDNNIEELISITKMPDYLKL